MCYVLTSNTPLISGPAWPMYRVDAESNSSSTGSLTTGTDCGSKHLPISSTASRVTFRLSRENLPIFHGTENVANTFDDEEYLFTSVYRKLTFIRLDEDGTACTPNCTTCERNGRESTIRTIQ